MTTRQALVLCAFQLIDVSFFSTIEAHLLLLVIRMHESNILHKQPR